MVNAARFGDLDVGWKHRAVDQLDIILKEEVVVKVGKTLEHPVLGHPHAFSTIGIDQRDPPVVAELQYIVLGPVQRDQEIKAAVLHAIASEVGKVPLEIGQPLARRDADEGAVGTEPGHGLTSAWSWSMTSASSPASNFRANRAGLARIAGRSATVRTR